MKQFILLLFLIFSFAFSSCKTQDQIRYEEAFAERMETYDPMDIQTHRVNSTCFSEIGYDTETQMLLVRFLESGKYYVYSEVPRSVYNSLNNAESIGGYYNEHIKGQYECRRLD